MFIAKKIIAICCCGVWLIAMGTTFAIAQNNETSEVSLSPLSEQAAHEKPSTMKLWKTINLDAYPGMFVCPGDLNNDGRMDFLLYREGPQTTPGYLVAVDHAGQTLWQRGDSGLKSHTPDGYAQEPALRGIALIYDIDHDGHSEVITEFWENDNPMFYILDGATGVTEKSRPSPLDLQVRSGRRTRCSPIGRIAFLDGKNPGIVLKYDASKRVPCYGVAMDAELNTLWELHANPHAMGHVPTVADVDGDGREEVLFGTLLADDNGKILWEKPVEKHADFTAIADVTDTPGKELFITICGTGPAYCMSLQGEIIWEKTRKEVPHGQAIWVGNFLENHSGLEAVILYSGHTGDFMTVDAATGKELARFHHYTVQERAYPDFPCPVNWMGTQVQSLWIPVDRSVVDGQGHVLASLGENEDLVRTILHWGNTKQCPAVQAFALDVCGDEREELILYQPYAGQGILIFTQPDGNLREKPYCHGKAAYNIRTYF